MGRNVFLKALIWVPLLGGVSLAMPSSNNDLNLRSILPLNDLLIPRSEPLEIRGVYGGKKRRYIILPRASSTCCKKPKCKATIGEFLDENCKCAKCKAGTFPSIDGLLCTDKCPQGKPNDKGGCDGPNEDEDRKGKCPDGQVLDIREGGQDSQTPNPKCAIDDSGKCPKGEIPRTRFEGYELDNDYKPECGKEPTDKPKCAKGRYEEVTVSSGPDGNTAKITCERTRQFKNEKNKKVKDNEFRTKQKEDWEKREPQRKEDNERRKQNVEKLKKQQDELKEQMEKIKQENDKNDRKKARMGKCAPVVALIEALNVATSLRKRQEEESPYDWTTDYFDEDFVQSDDFLQYWPADVKIEDIKEVTNEGVDAEAWMARWEAIVSARELRNSPGNCPGSKRSDGPKRRCTRSVDEDFDFDDDDDFTDFDGVRVFTGNDTLLERYAAAEAEIKLPPTDLMVRDPNYYVKRNPIAIIIEIIFFAARLGTSLLARTASALSRYAPRLAGLAKNTDRLFKVAPKGSGTPRGIDGMKNAMTRIVNNKSFRQCVAEGVPL